MNAYQFEQKLSIDFPVDEKFVDCYGDEMNGIDAWDALINVHCGCYGCSKEWFFDNVPLEYKNRWEEMEVAMNELSRRNNEESDRRHQEYLDAGDEGRG